MNTSHRNYSRESTNDWSMVDHMVCGVGGGVLLYSDLGYMVDLVVDLVTNMMDYRGSSNMDCWGSISNSGNSEGSKYMGSIVTKRGALARK